MPKSSELEADAPPASDAAPSTSAESPAAAPAPADGSFAPPPQRLSKAEKRARKAELLKERRAKKRQHRKEVHRKQVEGRREAREARLLAMPPEEQEAFRLADQQSREERYREVCEQNARVDEALKSGLRVAIDLSYGSFMDLKEQKSLGRQLSRCWGSNRRAAAPLSLHLAALDGCPAVRRLAREASCASRPSCPSPDATAALVVRGAAAIEGTALARVCSAVLHPPPRCVAGVPAGGGRAPAVEGAPAGAGRDAALRARAARLPLARLAARAGGARPSQGAPPPPGPRTSDASPRTPHRTLASE